MRQAQSPWQKYSLIHIVADVIVLASVPVHHPIVKCVLAHKILKTSVMFGLFCTNCEYTDRNDTNALVVWWMFRVRMLFKATRSHMNKNCVVSERRRRQTDSDDQLEPLDNRLMTEAVDSGRQQIQQVSLMSTFSWNSPPRLHHISHVTFHNLRHHRPLLFYT